MNAFELSEDFIRDRCDFCGRCFAECPVLALPVDQAQAEIRALVDSGASPVLDRCTGCMACNSICPRDANPHTLIVKAWGARNREQGIPSRARLVLPYQKGNLHAVAQAKMPEDERALLRQWEQNWRSPPDCDTMIFAGCNMLLLPFMLDSALYAEIPIFGSLELCCGEPLYRMGCWDAARTAALHVRDEFARMGLKRIIVPCLACWHLFNHVYPRVLGVPLAVEVISMEEWLLGRIKSGVIRLTPIAGTVALHDNCWAKASGEIHFEQARELLRLIGLTVVECTHTREKALCCGMCAAAARFRLRDIRQTATRLLDEHESTPADYIVEYCGGCHWLLNLINQLSWSKYEKPSCHILEIVQIAVGEIPKRRTGERMLGVMRSMALKLLWYYLKGGRFQIEEIAGRPIQDGDARSSGCTSSSK